MAVLNFVKMENGTGSRVVGKLQWGTDEYEVI